MSTPTWPQQPGFRPGAVVNGWVLGQDYQWRLKKEVKRGFFDNPVAIIAVVLGVVGVFLLLPLVLIGASSPTQPSHTPSSTSTYKYEDYYTQANKEAEATWDAMTKAEQSTFCLWYEDDPEGFADEWYYNWPEDEWRTDDYSSTEALMAMEVVLRTEC